MMTPANQATPVVLSLNAVDPSGISGLHNDIETCASLGAHCLGVATAILARDTTEIKEVASTDPGLVIEQTRALLEDVPVNIVKSSMLTSVENIEVLHSILEDYPNLPLVLEPTLVHSRADNHADLAAMAEASSNLLLPRAHLAIMAHSSVFDYSKAADNLDASAAEILETGCEHLLLMGLEKGASTTYCKLYSQRGAMRSYSNEGHLGAPLSNAAAVLSACISAYLAHGVQLQECVTLAHKFTILSLSQARRIGMGQPVPDRMHWARENNSAKH
ncbi:bifunctional hydroxymethylpyrimidine kinase/phosphomethylpyrimidine kinase [Halioxenophilus aromaticivorans]|uniref:Hydroxymethylpyrimidine/phosphomethylpyrimidine kinase n=1 Tax=Halioxenophilus aromaticivorans TaxID=1306992 RepID=A0AAV3UA25_9ALTE